MARNPTAADVAREAGVSRSAVSMVLNNNADGNVSPTAQQRIREAVQRLGYVPNAVAVALQSQRTNTIGVITDEIVTSPFAGRIISGAGSVARPAGYVLTVADTEGVPGRDLELAEALIHRHVDGLVYATGGLVELDPPEPLLHRPAVLANCYDPQERLAAVIPDEVTGMRRATEHVLGLGHRRIALLTGTSDSPATPLRRQGFEAACEEFGREGLRLTVEPTGWEIQDGYRAAQRLLALPEPPTAVLASNDRTATGVLLCAAASGLRVPEDLSLVGVDDQQSVADQLVPALTTVALPHLRIGARAVELLLEQLHGVEVPPAVERIDCPLIVRASTGPAPTR